MEFNRLVEEWKREVRSKSLMVTIAMHPAYQQMVGMGEKALPFIFERIKRADEKTYQWFWALAAITRQNPIPIELRGKVRKWLGYGSSGDRNTAMLAWTNWPDDFTLSSDADFRAGFSKPPSRFMCGRY